MKKINTEKLLEINEIKNNFKDFIIEQNADNFKQAIEQIERQFKKLHINSHDNFQYWLYSFFISKKTPTVYFNSELKLNDKNKASFILQSLLHKEVEISNEYIENFFPEIPYTKDINIDMDGLLNIINFKEKNDINYNQNDDFVVVPKINHPLLEKIEEYNELSDTEKQEYLENNNSKIYSDIKNILEEIDNPPDEVFPIIEDFLNLNSVSPLAFKSIQEIIKLKLETLERHNKNNETYKCFQKINDNYNQNKHSIWLRNIEFTNFYLSLILEEKIKIPDDNINEKTLIEINNFFQHNQTYNVFYESWLKNEKNALTVFKDNFMEKVKKIFYNPDIIEYYAEHGSDEIISHLITQSKDSNVITVIQKYNLCERVNVFKATFPVNPKIIKSLLEPEKFKELLHQTLIDVDPNTFINNTKMHSKDKLIYEINNFIETEKVEIEIIDKFMPLLISTLYNQWNCDVIKQSSYEKHKTQIYKKIYENANDVNLLSKINSLLEVDPNIYENVLNLYPEAYIYPNFTEFRYSKEHVIKFLKQRLNSEERGVVQNNQDINQIPKIMFFDLDIASTIVSFADPKMLYHLPEQHFQNIDFIIPCLNNVNQKNLNQVLMKMPEKIQKMVSLFSHKENKGQILEAFLNRKYIQQKLSQTDNNDNNTQENIFKI